LLPMFFVAAWLFPSRNIITPIQHAVFTDNMLILVPKNTTPEVLANSHAKKGGSVTC